MKSNGTTFVRAVQQVFRPLKVFADSYVDAQWTPILESFDAAANTMGLHTSWAKTKIQNVASGPSPSYCVISRHHLEAVNNRFTYLGSDVDSSSYCTPEILRRIGLASSIMSQLDRVWGQSRLSTTKTCRIYNSCVLSSLLCACETWTLVKADMAKLETFHTTNQRRILGIFWYEFVTNVEVATLSQLPSINEAVNQRRPSLWPRQAYGSGCSCPPSPTSLTSRQGSGQFGTWRRPPSRQRKCSVEQVTQHRALSF